MQKVEARHLLAKSTIALQHIIQNRPNILDKCYKNIKAQMWNKA